MLWIQIRWNEAPWLGLTLCNVMYLSGEGLSNPLSVLKSRAAGRGVCASGIQIWNSSMFSRCQSIGHVTVPLVTSSYGEFMDLSSLWIISAVYASTCVNVKCIDCVRVLCIGLYGQQHTIYVCFLHFRDKDIQTHHLFKCLYAGIWGRFAVSSPWNRGF